MRRNQELLDDIFCDDEKFRSAVLTGMLTHARRRKLRRNLARAVALAAVVFCAGLLLHQANRKTPAIPPAQIRTAELRVIPGTEIRLLSDEELLDMFAGRPVALIGEGNERQFVMLDTLRR